MDLARKIGAGVERIYNLWKVKKRIPNDVRHHFNNKVTFSKSLETTNYAIAVSRAEPIMQDWEELISVARRKDNGEIVDVQEAVKVAEAKMASLNDAYRGLAAVNHDLKLNKKIIDPVKMAAKNPEALAVLGQAVGMATPILKHLVDWLSETKYVKAGEKECCNFFEKRFSKVFKYWEAIDADELKAYIRGRQSGTDGANEWSDRSYVRHLNWVKQYWNWMLDNDHIDAPNLIDLARLMKKKANTRQNRIETQTESNLPYSIAEC